MPVASLPGPVSGIWHLGPVTVHGYALCVVLGVLALLGLTERRYRAVGGQPWLMIDIATVAVPAGLVGARIYRIIVDYQRYFGDGHDWVGIFRIWDGGLGLPGAAVAGIAAACVWCRRQNVATGPVLAAAAPGIAAGAAISLLGNWFAQSLYGPPSTVPWAVPISPASRIPGYQDFDTFQPLFLYEAVWDFAVGAALIYLIRRLSLTGDRALAICIGGYAVGMFGAQSLVLTGPQEHSGTLIRQLAAFAVLAGAVAYLYMTRARLGPEPLTAEPLITEQLITGALTTGPVSTGPVTTGPVTTGPVTTGPVTTGPLITGPLTTGSLVAGPGLAQSAAVPIILAEPDLPARDGADEVGAPAGQDGGPGGAPGGAPGGIRTHT